MLYPQIPKPILKKIASSLNIDLKLFGAELSVGIKGNISDETRYTKVQIVSEYIEKNLDVGSIEAPSTYFKGILPMRSIIYAGAKTQVVYFGGTTHNRIVVLGGAPEHLIGNKPSENPGPPEMPASTLDHIAYTLHKLYYEEAHSQIRQVSSITETYLKPESSLLKVAAIVATENLMTPELMATTQQLEFLAKTLKQGKSDSFFFNHTPRGLEILDSPYVIIGTPIYVAIAD